MLCPYCNTDTRVIDSRQGDDFVRRRRECPACEQRFTTHEQIVLSMPQVIKADGGREKFSEEKLRNGMLRALEKRPVDTERIENALNQIMRAIADSGEREIAAKTIGEAVMSALAELDEVAFIRFASVYRRFPDLDAFNDEVAKLKLAQLQRPNKSQQSIFNRNDESDENRGDTV